MTNLQVFGTVSTEPRARRFWPKSSHNACTNYTYPTKRSAWASADSAHLHLHHEYSLADCERRLPPLLTRLSRLLWRKRLTMTLSIIPNPGTGQRRNARSTRVGRQPIVLDWRKGKERIHVIRIHEQIESRRLIRLLKTSAFTNR
jgi:hypothetical protein